MSTKKLFCQNSNERSSHDESPECEAKIATTPKRRNVYSSWSEVLDSCRRKIWETNTPLSARQSPGPSVQKCSPSCSSSSEGKKRKSDLCFSDEQEAKKSKTSVSEENVDEAKYKESPEILLGDYLKMKYPVLYGDPGSPDLENEDFIPGDMRTWGFGITWDDDDWDF